MTRLEAKEKVQEWWGEAGIVTRASLVCGLIGFVWVGVTAALGTVDERYVLRREWNRQRDSLSAAAALHEVRDSSRQERIGQQLKYLICREDFTRQQCLRPDR